MILNWTFLKEHALSNPRGKIVSKGATGNDVDNYGAWDQSDARYDPIGDIMNGLKRLNNVPDVILMHPETYSNFISAIGFDCLYKIGAIFGSDYHDRSWLNISDDYEKGIVLVIAKHQSKFATGPDPAIVYIDVT